MWMTVRSYAKINLFLSIGARREDGFHDIVSIATTVDLHDELSFEISGRGIEIIAEESHDSLPPLEQNSIYRAIDGVRRLRHLETGMHVRLKKRIPMGAGLGGGSSNARAALHALDMLLGLRLTPAERLSLSAALGSDVPLFMHGGAVRMAGRGEMITPLADFDPYHVIIVKPPFSIDTGQAYRSWDESGSGSRPPLEPPGRIPPLYNDFERVLFPRYPVLGEIKATLLHEGCEAASLTGSGSAVYGLVMNREAAMSIACSPGVARHGRVILTRILGRNEHV